jgi:hypothetical protein
MLLLTLKLENREVPIFSKPLAGNATDADKGEMQSLCRNEKVILLDNQIMFTTKCHTILT